MSENRKAGGVRARALRERSRILGESETLRASLSPRRCADAHAQLGAALLVRRRLDDAEAALREGLRLDARRARTHMDLGDLLLQVREHSPRTFPENALSLVLSSLSLGTSSSPR